MSKSLTNSLRGLAVVLVIICHFIGGGFGFRYFTPLGGIGVAIFLFLSGFGLQESYRKNGIKLFWPKRLIRIIIPYLVWVVLLFLVSRLLKFDAPLFPHYWYLDYLLLWYALFWISKFFPSKYSPLFLLLVTVSLFFVLRNIQTEQSLSFLGGMLLSENKHILGKWKNRSWFVLAFTFLIIGAGCLAIKQLPSCRSFGEESILMKLIQLGIKLPVGLSLIIATWLSYKEISLFKCLAYIGIISLELYLVQMQFPQFVQGSFRNLILALLTVGVLSIILHYSSAYLSREVLALWRGGKN